MIAFNFAYYQPVSINEAISLYKDLKTSGKSVYYFSGGTEFISRARRNEITCDAVIDIKGIPETNLLEWDSDHLVTGASCSLSSIVNEGLFPLLGKVAKEIATQTERNKITLGGNIASNLPYKEAILPFLLADSDIVIASEKGTKQQPINAMYNKGRLLQDGEFIVQFITKQRLTTLPFIHIRRTKQSSVNYPVVSLAALQDRKETRIAISGLTNYPFRSTEIENLLQTKESSIENMMDRVIEVLPESAVLDFQATEEYRHFVLQTILNEVLSMKGAS